MSFRLEGIFLLPAAILTVIFINIPRELEWDLFFFLCIIVIFDRINQKVFSGFGYSFFNVILSLIIFDRFSVVYGFIYLLVDSLFAIVLKRKGSLQSVVSMLSIYTIIIIICNEIYNEFLDDTYLARYLTLLLMLFLSILFKYAYVFLETGAISSKLFLDRFVPMLFEIGFIFPILAFFNQLNVNLVLFLFLSYYTFIGFLHNKFMSINDTNIKSITKVLTCKYKIQIFYMDLDGIKGAFNSKKNMIIIDEKMDYPEQLQTLIHEMLHYQMRKKFNLPRKIEEFIIILFEAIISWYYIITVKNKPETE